MTPAPEPAAATAAAWYEGVVWHERTSPLHAFSQRVAMLYVDLDRLDEVTGVSPLLGVDARRPLQLRRDDHDEGGDDTSWSDTIRDLVAAETGARPTGAVRLLTNVRSWGWCFNPLSVYWCEDGSGGVAARVLEVTNTPWHERHRYVLGGDRTVDGDRASTDVRFPKAMHVSPFLPPDGLDYVLRAPQPGPRAELRLTVERDGHALLRAGFAATRRPLDPASVRRVLLRYPTQRLSAGIYGQAARLWRRGATVHRHPGARAAATVRR